MPKKDLKYFMREHKEEIVTVPGIETIKDEDGKVIDFEVRVLDQAEITKINDHYRTKAMATDKKGNPLVMNGEVVWKTERDSARATRHIIAEALVYPNLKDKEMMDFYHCHDITEMPLLAFPKSAEFNHVVKVVFGALGIGDFGDEEEESDLEAAKN